MLKYRRKYATSAFLDTHDYYGATIGRKVVIVPVTCDVVPEVPGVISFLGRIAVLSNTRPLTYQDMGYLVTVEEAILHGE